MKNTNLHDAPNNFRGSILNKIGDYFEQKAVDPRSPCWWGSIYEPALSAEMIEEMLEDN